MSMSRFSVANFIPVKRLVAEKTPDEVKVKLNLKNPSLKLPQIVAINKDLSVEANLTPEAALTVKDYAEKVREFVKKKHLKVSKSSEEIVYIKSSTHGSQIVHNEKAIKRPVH